jgi:nitrogen fixation/metabolism regulation signal transduction histidine kinase
MIFRIISIYRKTKKGLADPTGFVGEEVRDAYIGAAIVPGLILLAVVVLLFIFGYTNLVAPSSLFPKILFWVFLVVELLYVVIATVVGKMLNRLINAIEAKIKNRLTK